MESPARRLCPLMTSPSWVRIVGSSGQADAIPATMVSMSRTGARLVARLHVDHGHVSSAVCMCG